MSILHITNGDYFNEYFLSRHGGIAVPFCEVMMDGDTISEIYSDAFIRLRAGALGINTAEYRAKMHAYKAMTTTQHDVLCLWFGKDTFCQANLLTLLAYLEQIGYSGTVLLNYIDDETFDIIEEKIPVKLGLYKGLYEDILVAKKPPSDCGVLIGEAFDLYFDYHSDNGRLARLLREHSEMTDAALLCLLLQNSGAYGLSDRQALRLIEKYRK